MPRKAAISIDDELLREMDKTARSMGLSRSRLFAIAVDDFLKRERRAGMLLRLNQVYSGAIKAPEKRTLKGFKAKFSRTVKEAW
jgi:metal-responsive CopG/Arc/MetJ family transcriptional regulator